MKNCLIFLLTLLVLSCGSIQQKKIPVSVKTIEELNEIRNFTIDVPASWITVIDHGFLTYSPLDSANSYHNNYSKIFQIKPKNKSNLSDFAEEFLSSMKKISKRRIRKSSKIEDSNLGTLYIYGNHDSYGIKGYYIFFIQNGEYYVFRYASTPYFFNKYFNDAMSILSSFKLKN